MEVSLELCVLAAENKVDRLRAWYLAGADLSAGDYDKRTPLHVVRIPFLLFWGEVLGENIK